MKSKERKVFVLVKKFEGVNHDVEVYGSLMEAKGEFMDSQEKVCLGGREFSVRTKRVYQSNLTSDCWPVQVWGLPYCSGFGDPDAMCEYLATEECGGQAIRKKILSGRFPVSGLPDAGQK